MVDMFDECDPEMVKVLMEAALKGMKNACIEEVTTPSEIVSAAFTLLDHILITVRENQPPETRPQNTREIYKMLADLTLEHGKLPN